ncbi:hypothetical protein [Sphingomonas montana]|uniref:hypothetical protein n=1 Tax=Sphingomonas montana TaxID=1843236 RepID=UPI00096F100A|nr:hypothetical protein [Sphingomonas montana]
MLVRISTAFLIATVALPAVAAPRADLSVRHSPALDKELAGTVAGKPVDCISLPRVRSSMTLSNPDTIIYRIGRTRYVNQPAGGCNLRSDPIIVSQPPSTRLCRGDIISLVDRSSRFPVGSCGLGSFVPYTPAK